MSILQKYLKDNLTVGELPSVTVLRRVMNEGVNMEAPGQLLKHYAPYLPCYFYSGKPAALFLEKKGGKEYRADEVAFISFSTEYQ